MATRMESRIIPFSAIVRGRMDSASIGLSGFASSLMHSRSANLGSSKATGVLDKVRIHRSDGGTPKREHIATTGLWPSPSQSKTLCAAPGPSAWCIA